ncbi:uncharacterized protein LOC102719001 isoform X1 [Oryza brachyantha]|uniref:uncharacterized protein LOC102719001 isoform X1 n=1 Tax=Oryza brachyantha TaxID=4533 RepID=UPI000776933D|nr:uncharacterized protein LOC102719001 isoform X1 [Oryza brachyantha]
MGEFDDYWARAYRGDSGVPHSDPQRLVTTWTGAFALGAAACVHHHASALASNIKSLPHYEMDPGNTPPTSQSGKT